MSTTTRKSGPLPLGKSATIMNEQPTTAGQKEVVFPIDAESILLSLYVRSISGTLDVTVFTQTDDGQELEVISFPQVSAPTPNIELRKAASVMGNIKVRAVFSDAVDFCIVGRGVTAGETSVRILGANQADNQQATVDDVTPTLLIAPSPFDRAGLIIKNFSSSPSRTLFIGYTIAKTNETVGFPISPGESIGIDVSASVEVYGIASAGSIDVRIMTAEAL